MLGKVDVRHGCYIQFLCSTNVHGTYQMDMTYLPIPGNRKTGRKRAQSVGKGFAELRSNLQLSELG